MTPWFKKLPWPIITSASMQYKIPENLIGAIIYIESRIRSEATRYEPGYRWTTDPHTHAMRNYITADTEIIHQRISWGLMQIMGATARDLGYERSLVRLCEPKIGIQWGTRYLADLWKKYGILEDVISAYNAGSPRKTSAGIYNNQKYVDKVLKKMREIQFSS